MSCGRGRVSLHTVFLLAIGEGPQLRKDWRDLFCLHCSRHEELGSTGAPEYELEELKARCTL